MKSNKHKQMMQKIRKAALRIDELYDLIRLQPREKFAKPIFCGHWRFFVVRADVLRSSIGQQAQQVVNRCNNWWLGDKKDPKSYRGMTFGYYHKPLWHFGTWADEQHLKPLDQKQWDDANFPEFFKRKWFDIIDKTISFGSKNIVSHIYVPRVPCHMTEFAYKRAYKIESSRAGGDYSSELARLKDFMIQVGGWEKLHGSYRDDWDLSSVLKKERQKLKDKEMIEDLEL